jgi:hypothetical protein
LRALISTSFAAKIIARVPITTLLTLLGHSLFTIMPLWRQGDAYALCEF